MVTLSFSMAVKYLLYPRDLRFPAGMLSLRRRRALRDGISVISADCNCACVIAHVKPEINLKTIFSNTQHFAVYIRCMPSRRLLRLDTPLVQSSDCTLNLAKNGGIYDCHSKMFLCHMYLQRLYVLQTLWVHFMHDYMSTQT